MSFADMGTEIGKIVDEKNQAYGDSFARSGEILAILYPNGVRPDQFTDMLGIVRVLDKLFRIATNQDAFGESPWRDVSGYGFLGAANHEKRKTATQDVFEAVKNAQPNKEAVQEAIRKALSAIIGVKVSPLNGLGENIPVSIVRCKCGTTYLCTLNRCPACGTSRV